MKNELMCAAHSSNIDSSVEDGGRDLAFGGHSTFPQNQASRTQSSTNIT